MNENPAGQDPRNAPSRSTRSLSVRQRLAAMGLAALAGIGASFLLWQFIGSEPDGQVVPVRQTGVAAVGGPFELISHDGKTITDQDFAGHYMLIYFGYTWCPDVCPLSLQLMGDALTRLGDDAGKIRPVFITVDPERDTPEAIKSYLAWFHPDLIGLTGTPEQIAAVAEAYRMYYRKSAPLDASDPDSYGMDHMNIFYLMGPDGTYVTHLMNPESPADMADKIAAHMP